MNQIYQRSGYKIYCVNDEYIVHNSNLKGFAHSHIKNYKACLWIIDLAIKKQCPYDIPKYFVVSLMRLTDDKKYLENLSSILDRKNKSDKKKYYNINKGKR